MNHWKKVVAALASLPIAVAGLALGVGTAAAVESDGGLSDENLIAAYDFEDEHDKGKDVSGHGNNLILHGDPEYGKPGDFTSKVVQLRGGDGQYLELPTGLLDGTDSFTVQFDSKSRMGDGDNFFSFTIGSDNQRYFFSRLRPNSVYTAITKGSNGAEQGVSAKTNTSNVWHTYRISVSPSFIAVFQDGTLKGINTDVATKLSDLGANLPVNFGKSTWGADKYYNGGIDNVKVWTASYVSDGMVWDGVSLPGATETGVPLPAVDALGDALSWHSSDTTILGDDGVVVASPAKDTDVTMTASVTIGGVTYERDFTVTVLAAVATADAAADRLLVDYQLTAGTTLPTGIATAPGATVAWRSSDTALVADDGTVAGAEGDTAKSVDLTATIGLNGETVTKTFRDVRVMPKNAVTLASYTRDSSINGGARVGNALHIAVAGADGYEALNTNYGIAFAEAKITVGDRNSAGYPTETTEVRGIADPYLFRMKDGRYAYVGVFTDGSGNRVDGGSVAFSTSDDLMSWSGKPNEDERGDLIAVTDDTTVFDAGSIAAGYDASADLYRISWSVNGVGRHVTTKDFKTFSDVAVGPGFACVAADLTDVANAVSGNTLAVTAEEAAALAGKLGRVRNVGVEQPTMTVEQGADKDALAKSVKGETASDVASSEDASATLDKGATLTATYSDGSTFDFRVEWNEDELAAVDTSTPGEYTVTGTAIQQNYSEQFPMMSNRADPNIVYWQGKYYAMGTSDTGGMHTLFIRSSDTLAGLKDRQAGVNKDGGYMVEGQDVYLFGDDDGLGHQGYHWAPELHAITGSDGRQHLYCFYATVPDKSYGGPNWVGNAPVAYVMELKEGGDPMKTADWIEHRVQRTLEDGSLDNLSNLGLTIDMTYFEVDGKSYIAWSQGNEERAGAKADVSIAEVDKDKPWVATTTPTRLMRPEWGWELDGVNEGPNVLVSEGKVYMVFSAQLVTPQYATGMLVADVGDDLTDPSVWTKSNYPWLHNGTFAGQYGLGHNSYFTDPYGDVYNVYHAMTDANRNTNRHAGVIPVHFRADGTPIIDMTTTEELLPEYAAANAVTLTITVKGEDPEPDPDPEPGPVDPDQPTEPDQPTDPDQPGKDDGDGKDDGGASDGKTDASASGKPARRPGLSRTGVAVLGVGGAMGALALAGISLTLWRRRRA